ncbi:hypothetical protein D3C87_197110 [compost metagenome]
MKRILFPLLLIAAACSTKPGETKPVEPAPEKHTYADIIPSKDTLFSISSEDFEYGTSCGYVNKKGDTIIPEGTFENCFSNIFTTFVYVADKRFKDQGMVAVNRNKEVIFEAYIFDNGPDYINEGLFRIVRNGKIGFADESGKVVIDALYNCAYPFEDGKAKVALNCETIEDGEHSSWKSDQWFYIDRTGKKVN